MEAQDFTGIPIYKKTLVGGAVPILEKNTISENFPDGWMTPRVQQAIENGDAEYVTTTGTNHDRMQLIRPPYFLLKTYFNIWQTHADTKHSWQ